MAPLFEMRLIESRRSKPAVRSAHKDISLVSAFYYEETDQLSIDANKTLRWTRNNASCDYIATVNSEGGQRRVSCPRLADGSISGAYQMPLGHSLKTCIVQLFECKFPEHARPQNRLQLAEDVAAEPCQILIYYFYQGASDAPGPLDQAWLHTQLEVLLNNGTRVLAKPEDVKQDFIGSEYSATSASKNQTASLFSDDANSLSKTTSSSAPVSPVRSEGSHSSESDEVFPNISDSPAANPFARPESTVFDNSCPRDKSRFERPFVQALLGKTKLPCDVDSSPPISSRRAEDENDEDAEEDEAESDNELESPARESSVAEAVVCKCHVCQPKIPDDEDGESAALHSSPSAESVPEAQNDEDDELSSNHDDEEEPVMDEPETVDKDVTMLVLPQVAWAVQTEAAIGADVEKLLPEIIHGSSRCLESIHLTFSGFPPEQEDRLTELAQRHSVGMRKEQTYCVVRRKPATSKASATFPRYISEAEFMQLLMNQYRNWDTEHHLELDYLRRRLQILRQQGQTYYGLCSSRLGEERMEEADKLELNILKQEMEREGRRLKRRCDTVDPEEAKRIKLA